MGCKSSTARVNNPQRLRQLNLKAFAPQVIEEDEKNNNEHAKPSQKEASENRGSTPLPSTQGEENEDRNENNKTQDAQRQSHMFNLFENSQKSRQVFADRSKFYEDDRQGLESYRTNRDRILTDESAFKISQEQHDTIVRFVDERRCNLQATMVYLYENLSKNLKEHERLGVLVEDLRSTHKDIENCIDDLLSYPLPDEEKYMESLVSKLKVVNEVSQEYTMFCRNLRVYKELRTNILNILLQNDPILPNARLYPLRYQLTREEKSFVAERDTEVSKIFIPRDDEPRSSLNTPGPNKTATEFDFDLKLNREESRNAVYCEGITLQDQINRQKVLISGLMSTNPALVTNEDAFLLFFKLTDDQEKLDGDLMNLQQRFEIINAGLKEYKKSEKSKVCYSSQTIIFKEAKESLQREGETLRQAYQEILNETTRLKQRLHENDITGPEQQEYQARLNELQEKTENSVKQILNLHQKASNLYVEEENDTHANVSLYYSECNDKSNETDEHSVGDEERSHCLTQSVQRNANNLNRTVLDTSNLNLPDFPHEENHKPEIIPPQVITNQPQNLAILRLNTQENESQLEFEAVSVGLSSKPQKQHKSLFYNGFEVSAFEETTRLQDLLK